MVARSFRSAPAQKIFGTELLKIVTITDGSTLISVTALFSYSTRMADDKAHESWETGEPDHWMWIVLNCTVQYLLDKAPTQRVLAFMAVQGYVDNTC